MNNAACCDVQHSTTRYTGAGVDACTNMYTCIRLICFKRPMNSVAMAWNYSKCFFKYRMSLLTADCNFQSTTISSTWTSKNTKSFPEISTYNDGSALLCLQPISCSNLSRWTLHFKLPDVNHTMPCLVGRNSPQTLWLWNRLTVSRTVFTWKVN